MNVNNFLSTTIAIAIWLLYHSELRKRAAGQCHLPPSAFIDQDRIHAASSSLLIQTSDRERCGSATVPTNDIDDAIRHWEIANSRHDFIVATMIVFFLSLFPLIG